ncbi:MAG TPA: hypothetical protein DFJ59_04995 [Alphaproteobacteria bacterium]|nr:hypothetical protein [Euryarchaeota archaeon]HCI00130.1 hypothetical protein [Alphaproteobacteria bacterium]|tara:strand:- start:282 stop:575 length:294 start_codon:yes stop_codon:yes gene_type:complete
MSGFLKGVGMGVAWGAALLVPFPLLIGGALAVGLSQQKRKESNLTQEQQDTVASAGVDLNDPESVEAFRGDLDEFSALLRQMESSSEPDAVWSEWNV